MQPKLREPWQAFFRKNPLFWAGAALFSCYLSVIFRANGRSTALFGNLLAPPGFLAFALEFGVLLALALALLAALCGTAVLWARWQQMPARTSPPLRGRWFLVIFAALALLWLGYYALEYPGVCSSADTEAQLRQAQAGQYSNWHPILHTLLLGFLTFRVGHGSIVPYMLFQIIAMAAVLTYVSYWINTRAAARFRLTASLVWYGLHPIFAYMSFNASKDTLFSLSMLLLTVELAELTLRPQAKSPRARVLHLAILFAAALGVLFLRNNGFIVILSLLPAALLLRGGWRGRLRLCAVMLAAALVFFAGQAALFRAYSVRQTPITEALAIPLQHIGRVVSEKRPMTQEETTYFSRILPMEAWDAYYNASKADTLKFSPHFKGAVIADDPALFLRRWGALALRYPADACAATLDEAQMLWDPVHALYWRMLDGTVKIKTFDFLRQRSPAPALTEAVHQAIPRLARTPALRPFWNPAHLFWVSVIAALLLLLRRQKERLLAFVPCWALWVSLLLTIPHGRVGRYVYCIYLCAPIFIALLGRKKEEEPDADTQRHAQALDVAVGAAAADAGRCAGDV